VRPTARSRAALRAGTVAVTMAAALLTGCGDDDGAASDTAATVDPTVDPTVEPTVASTTPLATTTSVAAHRIEVEVAGGRVVGGSRREAVPLGEEVTIVVRADVAEEVHVHGYDLLAEVAPGVPAELTFVADIPGVFEVELEASHTELLRLEVA